MKLAYLDCLSGISGDMTLGALVDCGVELAALQAGIDSLGFPNIRLTTEEVKRHGFRGGPKTHGQSDRHRAPGSIGSGTTPGRVRKGLRMAGHMGDARVTVKNLRIFESDPAKGILLIEGSVPGGVNGLLRITKKKGK